MLKLALSKAQSLSCLLGMTGCLPLASLALEGYSRRPSVFQQTAWEYRVARKLLGLDL